MPPKKPLNEKFGQKIKELREAKKKTDPAFSLRGFANAVGVSPSFMSQIENSESTPPSAGNIKKMAELLGYDADELLALAGRFDPALEQIITKTPRAMADLLRTAQAVGATDDDLKELTARLLSQKSKD